ncbi:MAG TPA: 2-oxoisovalerate dehydrogenase [Chloroflexi bacterium]|nr:2-oxoisovalerate dehydrogenase [Chloroflexota bacterium]
MTDKEIIFLVEESPEGGYEARALGHSIFSEADTYEDLKQMVHDAVVCHFEPEARSRLARLLVGRRDPDSIACHR